MLCVR